MCCPYASDKVTGSEKLVSRLLRSQSGVLGERRSGSHWYSSRSRNSCSHNLNTYKGVNRPYLGGIRGLVLRDGNHWHGWCGPSSSSDRNGSGASHHGYLSGEAAFLLALDLVRGSNPSGRGSDGSCGRSWELQNGMADDLKFTWE